ncbi:T6SS effector amidase Tae4 family protein [Paraburkholderia sp. HP33-1]|uniref:T6SS effector amidase Tae4 family protein n=1 Tax=Paraburkholderia sp. HP33-1 TaxID=2883243 RepID=UPI001F22ADE0|nr:T6SS effector amidase Tae4 family protein [Paraburkholderia sp. HP33-1]
MPNKRTHVHTNPTQGSVKKVALQALTFDQLWSAYPKSDPCSGPYRDQCAARIGEALRGCGIEGLSFKGARCHVDHPKHMLRAAEVADWLHKIPFAGCPAARSLSAKTWDTDIHGTTGIIFFNGYWHRDSDGPGVTAGNHIDLWNGNRLTMSGVADTLATVGRFVFGRQSFLAGTDYGYSDLHNSSSILSWEVK